MKIKKNFKSQKEKIGNGGVYSNAYLPGMAKKWGPEPKLKKTLGEHNLLKFTPIKKWLK